MQFTASYIGHLFQLDKPHDCGGGVVLSKDMVGTLKALNLQEHTMLLEFPMSQAPTTRTVKAWIPETSVLLFAGSRPAGPQDGSPPEAAAPASPSPKKPWKERFSHGLVAIAKKSDSSNNISQVGIFTPQDLDATKVVGARTGLLVIVFKDSRAYSYEGVDLDTFEGLKAAPSAMKYFNAHIKGNSWMHPTELEA